MKTPRNAFKAGLADGRLQLGLWLALGDSYSAEICATCGFDWLLIDGEHAPYDLRTILHTLQAVAPYSSSPVVRIPNSDVDLIKQVLELGAQTLLIPMVETATEARRLARAMRYPPAGTRGVGSGLARSSRWRLYPDYLAESNNLACLLVQIETVAGLEKLEEIAQVDGVDGIFLGPADLAASMGLLGQASHPDVHRAILNAIEKVLGLGRPVGILCAEESLAREYITAGATFVAIGVDTTMLAQAGRALNQRFQR